jgi:AI-2 transport protein TqsA
MADETHILTRESEQKPAFRSLLMAACLMVIVTGLKLAASFFVPVVVSFFLSVLSYPLMKMLEKRRVPHFLAMLLTVLFIIGVITAILQSGTSLLFSFYERVPQYLDGLQRYVNDTAVWLESKGVAGAKKAAEQAFDWQAVIRYVRQDEVQKLLTSTVGATVGTVSFALSQVTLVFILMIFILTEARGITSRVQAILAAGGPDLSKLLNSATDIQKYLGIKTVISAICGILAGLWCWVFELEYPILWGILMFVLHFIPAVGAIFAGIPAVLVALVQQGTGTAVAIAIGYLAINFTLGNFIEPTLMGRRFGVSPLVILMSVLFWGFVWGPVGMFLAVPLTIMIKVVMDNTEEFRWLSVGMSKKKVTQTGEIVLETSYMDEDEMLGGGAATEPPH